MRKFSTRYIVPLLALVLFAGTAAQAQTTVNSTTLAAAVSATTNTITLTSVSNVLSGDIVFVDREAMRITSTGTLVATNIQVARGQAGTAARNHGSLAVAYTGVPARFYQVEVTNGAACTSTTELFLPHVVLSSGNVYQCTNSKWNQIGADFGAIDIECRIGTLFTSSIDQLCFTASRPYTVVKITEWHVTPESGGTLTMIPKKTVSLTAVASGTALATAISGVSIAANTLTTLTVSTVAGALDLAAGDTVGIDFTDDVAGELAGVVFTFTLVPR